MSAEGKKKRGESGVSNAKNIAFRYGGSPCDFSTTIRRTSSPYGAGSRLVQALRVGAMLGHYPSGPLMTKADAAMSRCTHPQLRG